MNPWGNIVEENKLTYKYCKTHGIAKITRHLMNKEPPTKKWTYTPKHDFHVIGGYNRRSRGQYTN